MDNMNTEYRKYRVSSMLGPYLFFVMLAVVVIFTGMFAGGCGGKAPDSNEAYFHLNLNKPDISGRTVVINGGVVAPVERIEWDWGDGKVLKHHYFPAAHTYSRPGTYEIKVKAFDHKGRTCTRTVKVEVR